MKTDGTLLLIENDEADIRMFMIAAKELGFDNKVHVVNDGVEALKYIQEIRTEKSLFMILCDMNMPLMTGMELKREIEKTMKMHHKAIPFIFLSTSRSEEFVEEAFELGVQGCFVKGKDYQEYLETLQIIIKYWDICEHPGSKKDHTKDSIA
ncbi:MAG TPA: response regulator [Bacteroidia bacterium]